MRNILLLLMICCIPLQALADFTVRIGVKNMPPVPAGEAVYVTGNFNKWNPGDSSCQLQPLADGSLYISLHLSDIPSDRLEFKFTRGDWDRLECNARGRLEGPRILELNRDTSVVLTIEGWRDDFPKSTASEQVHVLDSAMYLPVFDDYRTIWIYLPSDYDQSGERYPVMYVHDGQQMFDEATSTGRIGPVEWGIDEVLDSMTEKCIVVAINHNELTSKRIEEYLVFPNEENPVARGAGYLDFIVNSLKPLVDRQFRTRPDKDHTTLMGSSLGGLLSLYGGLMHPDVFGNLGILSPSIWYDGGNIEKFIQDGHFDTSSVNGQRYFFYAGSNENRRMPNGEFVQMDDDVKRVLELLEAAVRPEIKLMINPNGRHGGLYWREVFPVFYQWLTENGK